MTSNIVLTLLVILLSSGLVAALAAVADRNARAAAWRQIALERRWDQEHRRGQQ